MAKEKNNKETKAEKIISKEKEIIGELEKDIIPMEESHIAEVEIKEHEATCHTIKDKNKELKSQEEINDIEDLLEIKK